MNLSAKTTYILLRNNKESGPFSFEQLSQMGLFATDLLWVEGQSVYWLAPYQLPELKEQIVINGEKPVPEQVIYQPATVNEASWMQETWKEYVPQKEETVPAPVAYNGNQHAKMAEVKEMYVNEVPPHKLRLPITPQVKRYLPYAALLLVGIAGGMLINGNKKKSLKENKSAVSVPLPVDTGKPAFTGNTTQDTVSINPVGLNALVPLISTVTPPEKTRKEPANPASGKEKPLVTDSPTAEIKSTEKTEEPVAADKIISRENLSSNVSVRANDYIVASFGGIRNLELTLKNDSRHLLDKVVVEVQYLKPRDEFLKSETVSFYQVPPDGSQTIAVKKSNRGVKVNCRVISIESAEPD